MNLLTEASSGGGMLLLLVYVVVIGGAMYFFAIRPQKKEQKRLNAITARLMESTVPDLQAAKGFDWNKQIDNNRTD